MFRLVYGHMYCFDADIGLEKAIKVHVKRVQYKVGSGGSGDMIMKGLRSFVQCEVISLPWFCT